MTRRRGARLALVALLVAALAATPGSAVARPTAANVLASHESPCGPTGVAAAPSGRFSIEGGPLPATDASGVPLAYSAGLALVVTDRSTGAVVSVSCVRATVTTTVGANGSFAFASILPNATCPPTTTDCASVTGPYGPYYLRPTAPGPVGYSVSVARLGPSTFAVAYVYDLASVSLTPGGPTDVVSPGAPTPVQATGRMANGSATPLSASYRWSLNGTGWSLTAASGSDQATVVADPGAGIGRLTVTATATVGNTTLAPPAATLTLVPQPTAIESAAFARTTVDVGSPISVRISGVGAFGYPYTAEIDPGLGLPAVAAACTTTGPSDSVLNISCLTTIAYPAPGLAQPTGRLSNGYSSSTWQFAEITVDRTPELSVDPAAPVGYVGAPVAITVSAANGTGAAPFAVACLAGAGVTTVCDSSPGPSWTFGPVFASPGVYPIVAWAIDADGANGSAGATVTVVSPLAVGAIVPGATNLTVGTPVTLAAVVIGGELPLRYWWNASDQAGSLLAGTTGTDGALSVAFVGSAAGAVTVSLTVVDAHHSRETVERLLEISPAAAISVVAAPPLPPASVVAGRPAIVAWSAVDRAGAPVAGFSATVVVELSGPAASGASVNASGIGPLSPIGNETFAVPSSAWRDGELEISVTATDAGALTVALVGSGLPAAPAPVGWVVDPDLAHLRLLDPEIVRPGARSNATLWQVTDRYGNPAVGAPVTVVVRAGALSRTTVVPVVAEPDGGSAVWVNYTFPSSAGGNVTVLDAAGDRLVGPLAIPPVAGPPPISATTVTVAAAAPLGALGAVGFGIHSRRARRRRTAAVADADLRRLAEGRSQVVEVVRRAGAADVPEIEAAWQPAPAPPELADWVASLVADGTLGATLGDDGRARFCLAPGRAGPPKVTVDADAFDAAEHRRASLWDDREAP